MPRVPSGSLSPNLAHLSSLVAFSTKSKSDSKAFAPPLPGHKHSIAEKQVHLSSSKIFEPVQKKGKHTVMYIIIVLKF